MSLFRMFRCAIPMLAALLIAVGAAQAQDGEPGAAGAAEDGFFDALRAVAPSADAPPTAADMARAAELFREAATWLIREKDPDRAIPLFEQGLAVNPLDAKAWALLGDAYEQKDRIEDAHDAYGRALSLETDGVRRVDLTKAVDRLAPRVADIQAARQREKEARRLAEQLTAAQEANRETNPLAKKKIRVGSSLDSHFSSIAEAIDFADSGAEIRIEPGVYRERPVSTQKSLTLIGLGAKHSVVWTYEETNGGEYESETGRYRVDFQRSFLFGVNIHFTMGEIIDPPPVVTVQNIHLDFSLNTRNSGFRGIGVGQGALHVDGLKVTMVDKVSHVAIECGGLNGAASMCDIRNSAFLQSQISVERSSQSDIRIENNAFHHWAAAELRCRSCDESQAAKQTVIQNNRFGVDQWGFGHITIWDQPALVANNRYQAQANGTVHAMGTAEVHFLNNTLVDTRLPVVSFGSKFITDDTARILVEGNDFSRVVTRQFSIAGGNRNIVDKGGNILPNGRVSSGGSSRTSANRDAGRSGGN